MIINDFMARRWRDVSLIGISTVILLAVGCTPVGETPSLDAAPAPTTEAAIRSFCGDCHLMPASRSFAKSRWREEVEQGFRLYARSGRTDLVKSDFAATLEYFSADAPEALTFEPADSIKDDTFQRVDLALENDDRPVAISHTVLLDHAEDQVSLAMADIWTGRLSIVSADDDGIHQETIGRCAHPSHIHQVDLTGDDVNDFVVSDLGAYNPENSNQASLWLFIATNDGYERRPLKLGLSRLASVRSLDYDSDGDNDLIVGDFGMHFVGSIHLLTNEGLKDGFPNFTWSVLDNRPGVIDTPVVDFNGDGRPDIVALVSQHHETIDVHLNKGDGTFESNLIYQAPGPSYGSSGIEVVDFEGDGDMDVIYTNGDTFDDGLAKPYHAIHWLENEGSFPFTHHMITSLPGVYCATAGDIDLDGDLDIAAVSLLGEDEIARQPPGMFDGVIWMEQTEPGKFRRHSIVADVCDAATCRLIDWDDDGDPDLLVPPHRFDRQPSTTLTLYRNLTRQ